MDRIRTTAFVFLGAVVFAALTIAVDRLVEMGKDTQDAANDSPIARLADLATRELGELETSTQWFDQRIGERYEYIDEDNNDLSVINNTIYHLRKRLSRIDEKSADPSPDESPSFAKATKLTQERLRVEENAWMVLEREIREAQLEIQNLRATRQRLDTELLGSEYRKWAVNPI